MNSFGADAGSGRSVGDRVSRASQGTTIVLASRVSVSPDGVNPAAGTVRTIAASHTTRITPTTAPALPRMT
jgi:hypothetical protein